MVHLSMATQRVGCALAALALSCGGRAGGGVTSTGGAMSNGGDTVSGSAPSSGGDTASGSVNSASSSPLQSVAQDQFPNEIARVLCQVQPCCERANIPFDASGCRENGLAAGADLLTELAQPNARYDPVGAARCLNLFQQEIATCQKIDGLVELACEQLFVGTLAAGAACANDGECAPPGYCQFASDGGATGTCVATGSRYPRGKAGDPCISDCVPLNAVVACDAGPAGFVNYCYASDGVYCAQNLHTCQKFGQLGEACTAGTCAAGEYCSGNLCAQQSDANPCVPGSEACLTTSYCDGTHCVPKKPDGESCSPDSNACAGGECIGAGITTPGVCGRETAATAGRCGGELK